jgi:hypothetical protein
MFFISSHLSRRASPSKPFPSCHSSVHRRWARRHLTPQERAYLSASYTPLAVVTASMGGHIGR